MSQIRAAARGTTRAGIPTPRRACSRPATPRPWRRPRPRTGPAGPSPHTRSTP